MSLITNIADAVATELNEAPAGTFDRHFTAKRCVLPAFEPADLDQLRISVVPKRMSLTGATRMASEVTLTVDIGIQKRLDPATDDALDSQVASLGHLVDQIIGYLQRHPLRLMPAVAWVELANDPVYAPEHLLEQRIFTSVLTVTYRTLTTGAAS